MIKRFKQFKLNENTENEISKYNSLWKKEFPELRYLNLIDSGDNTWTYTFYDKENNIEIDLSISKNDSWTIDFDMSVITDNDVDNYSYNRSSLSYDDLLTNIEKVVYYLRVWNRKYYKENGVNILKSGK